MLKEIAHFVFHAPGNLALMRRLPQAEVYDAIVERANAAGLDERRAKLVEDLEGEVLEVGSGTGMMFRHYPASTSVTALEPDASFLERAPLQAEKAEADITLGAGDGTSLPFDADRFDAAVFGFVLCSVSDVEQVLSETHRVLRPGGKLRLLEHVRSRRRIAGTLMDAFNPIWIRLNQQGCNMNRDPLPLIERAGFRLEGTSSFQVFAPGMPAFPMQQVWASKR